MNYHDEQAEGILRKLRNSQEESPFEHRRRRILNDKKYESSKGQKNRYRRISQNMEKAFKKMAQVFGYPNREYKDRVFRMLLKDPKVALEVYTL